MSRYLITGATSGLGKRLAERLGQHGQEVVTLGRRQANFFDPAKVTAAVRMAAETAPLDGIVHCAGIEAVSPLRITGDQTYREAMMAADSAFAILRAASGKGVIADGGSIVLMSSVAAHRGTPGLAAYSAGKAAIEAMARCAAIEFAPRRIRVNCLAAGAFRSPMHDRITGRMPAAAVTAYEQKHPLGFGNVEAVADAVLHLLSPAARWVTGTTVVVDGGLLSA